MRWINKEAINKIYKMFKMKNIFINMFKNLKSLSFRRFYELLYIIRNIHLMLINERCIKFYVNNFID